jgi:aspartate/methionine/tyrosine aminotransferase
MDAVKNTPIPYDIVSKNINLLGLEDLGKATIRELVRIVNRIEEESGMKYIRMEMGVPGLAPPQVGTEAEIEALKAGWASKYPMIEGLPILKKEVSRFVKSFLNIDVLPDNCVPTVGSMQGGYASFMVSCRRDVKKDTTLFIDPGFPVQKQQHNVMGLKYESFDVYDYRGEKLRDKLESYLSKGNISTILYSNPNNPSWICFTEKELKIIGELATKYDVIVMEDLAYFAMDFRRDLYHPGKPPYQVTVANYTDNYMLLISSSKAFSYAGQRIGTLVISDTLAKRRFPDLKRYFSSDEFSYALIYGALYSLSSGTAHTPQYALAAMLKATNDGTFNFIDDVKIYGERAKFAKQVFLKNGFELVYDKDEDETLADGFYFTFSYPGMTASELLEKLLYYGISAISLAITGSSKQGLRACMSQMSKEQYPDLEERLALFHQNNPVK